MADSPAQTASDQAVVDVTFAYSEKATGANIPFPASTRQNTVLRTNNLVKKIAVEHWRDAGLEGMPSIKNLHATFYPRSADNSIIGDVLSDGKQGFVLLTATPDAPNPTKIASTFLELKDARPLAEKYRAREAQEAADRSAAALVASGEAGSGSSQPTGKAKRRKGVTSPPIVSQPAGESDDLMNIVKKMQADMQALHDESEAKFKAQEDEIKALKGDVKRYKEEVDRQSSLLNLTVRATAGDKAAIGHLRVRILQDIGRNKLANLCGYDEWLDFRATTTSADACTVAATDYLLAQVDELTPGWKELARDPKVMKLLTQWSAVRELGNETAHKAYKKDLAEGVLSLAIGTEARMGMTKIFTAVYDTNPESYFDSAATGLQADVTD